MTYSHIATLASDPLYVGNVLAESVYSTIDDAINNAPNNTLLLIPPRTYITSATLLVNRHLTLAGYGGRPVIRLAQLLVDAGGHLVTDGITLLGPDARTLRFNNTTNLSALLHRTNIRTTGVGSGTVVAGTGGVGVVRFYHSTIERGLSTFEFGDLSRIDLHRCYTPSYLAHSSMSGALNLDDKVLTPTEGYGHESGDPIINPSEFLVNLSSRVIDIVASNPRAVIFNWQAPAIHCIPAHMDADGNWSDAFVPAGIEFGIYYLSNDYRGQPRIEGPYLSDEAPL